MCIRDRSINYLLSDLLKEQYDNKFNVTAIESFEEIINNCKLNDYDWKLGKTLSGISCLLYTSDAADERSSVDLGGRRIIKKKNK